MSTRDKFEIYDAVFQKLDALIEKSMFTNCYSMCSDLTRYSSISNYTDGLLISEILEGIFSQLNDVFERYKIPESEQCTLTTKMKDGIQKISMSYKDEDKNPVYDGLKNMRNDATCFQMKCWNSFSHKPVKRRGLGELI